MAFTAYLKQFITTGSTQTHLSFAKGKYYVPDNKLAEFNKFYYDAMVNGEGLYLIEKIHNCTFAFFLDIDSTNEVDIKSLTTDACNILKELFLDINTKFIVSKRENKYHVNFPHIIVNSDIAKLICTKLDKPYIDTSVYRTGLRMIGSKKSDKEKDAYRLYDIDIDSYIDDISFETFMETTIRRQQNLALSKLITSGNGNSSSNSNSKPLQIKGIKNNKVVGEIQRLFEYLKESSDIEYISKCNFNIERIYATQNKAGLFCYYISISERYCPFKQRNHQRQSSPIYVEIGINGIHVKCYDQDCLRRRYPESGIKLPKDLEINFPELYLSMTTKYWKAEVQVSDDQKRHLEESLKGSHYQIAKAAFNIYKERFRVDDVKNTSWYEYDGVRWSKSHSINILISEELPKYYMGIKISDTSIPKSDLQEFLVNNDKIDANLRNQLVDNIVAKLENVTFKNNIMNQITYLYKNYDPFFYENLDSNPYLLGFKNGVYDFQSMNFRPSTENDYVTFSTNYEYIDYDENNENVKEIYAFLSKIITNTKVREYLLKVLGSSLVGIPDEKFYIWTGLSGANGKSTLVNFLEQTLGDYITSVDVSLLTNKRGNSSNASPDVVRLRGKRIFTFQEPEHDDKLRTGILKQYTGGDTIIARELFKPPITFKLQGTMIMCCNDLPSVASIDGGTWRRIRVIEFNSRFCDNPVKPNEFKIDPQLKLKMNNWKPYFMSVLIYWYKKSLEEGIQEPCEVKRATSKYKADNDKFNEFFDQCLEETPHKFETNKFIYSQLAQWWSNNYPNSKIPDLKELRRALKIKYGTEQEKIINGVTQYGFHVSVKSFDDVIE